MRNRQWKHVRLMGKERLCRGGTWDFLTQTTGFPLTGPANCWVLRPVLTLPQDCGDFSSSMNS